MSAVSRPIGTAAELSVSHVIDRRGRCRLAFEPVADLARGVVCGYEAVARFPASMHPDLWRAEAVKRGLEPDIDAFVVSSVLQARESLPPDCFLTFNVPPEALLRPAMRELLEHAGRLDNLVVELAPRMPAGLERQVIDEIAGLRAAGATVAVDDVGAGYPALRFMRSVRPEFVKVHPMLVRDVHRDDAKHVLLETIGQLASRLDAWVVALGVEQIEELDTLVRMRVPLAQGPLVGVHAKTLTQVGFPLAAYVRERGVEATRPGELVRLLERPSPLGRDAERAEIARVFAGSPELRHVVLVDERRRPIGVVERAAFERGEDPHEHVMTVAPSADPAEVARRAMLRPVVSRFDPLVCCDVRGRYVGVVRIEQLVTALADGG